MPSFRCQYLDKWLHKGQISQEEYDKAIKKLDGHDANIEQDAYMRGYNQGYFKGESDGRFFSRVETIDEVISLSRTEIDFESQAEQKRFVEFMEGLKMQKGAEND